MGGIRPPEAVVISPRSAAGVSISGDDVGCASNAASAVLFPGQGVSVGQLANPRVQEALPSLLALAGS